MDPHLTAHLTALAAANHHMLPSWLDAPEWLRPAERAIGRFVIHNPGLGLLVVIFCEELGVPLPVPGDVAILSSGYLVALGRLNFFLAVAAVVAGAMAGSFILFSFSRRYGHGFLLRYGRYIGLDHRRMAKAEGAFRRWGPWAVIIGRHIPGMRVIISALAGSFEMRPRVFVASVAISSTIWGVMFVELGRVLGRRTFGLFRIFPGHLLPYFAVTLGLAVIGYHVWERRRTARERRKAAAEVVES